MEQQIFPERIANMYDYKSVLGVGGQGTVCLYQNYQTQEKVAIKFEPSQSTDQSLLHESLLIRKLKENQTLTRIPQYISHNTINGNRYLVMEVLEQSISEYLKQYQGLELERAIRDVSEQMLDALEQFHSTFNIHRDVKPGNFRVKNGKVYLIDFGNSFEFLDKDNKHRQLQTGQIFKGTLHFASINCHEKFNQSRRDDLEGLGYTILFFLTQGDIEFMKIECNDRAISSKTHLEFARLKRQFIEDGSISPSLYGIQEYLRHVRQIQFDEKPNYEELKGILSNLHKGYSQTAEVIIDKFALKFMTEWIQEVEQQIILEQISKVHCEKIYNDVLFQEIKDVAQSCIKYNNKITQEIDIALERLIQEVLIPTMAEGAKQAIQTFEQQKLAAEKKASSWKLFGGSDNPNKDNKSSKYVASSGYGKNYISQYSQGSNGIDSRDMSGRMNNNNISNNGVTHDGRQDQDKREEFKQTQGQPQQPQETPKTQPQIVKFQIIQKPLQIQSQNVECNQCNNKVDINEAKIWTIQPSIKCYNCLKIQDIETYLINEQNEWEALNKKFTETFNKIKDLEGSQQFMDSKIKENFKIKKFNNTELYKSRLEEIQLSIIYCKQTDIGEVIKFNQEKLEFNNFVSGIKDYQAPEFRNIYFFLNKKLLQSFTKQKSSWGQSANDYLKGIQSISVYSLREKEEYLMEQVHEHSWVLNKQFKKGQDCYFFYIITSKDKKQYQYHNPRQDTVYIGDTKYNVFKK